MRIYYKFQDRQQINLLLTSLKKWATWWYL
jgi:hypothetical protein